MTNFVLVHGGMIGETCWKKIRKPLEVIGVRPDTDQYMQELVVFYI